MSPTHPTATCCDNRSIIAAMSTRRTITCVEQHLPLPTRGHCQHAAANAAAAVLPTHSFVTPSTRNEKSGQNNSKCVSHEDTVDYDFFSANTESATTAIIGQSAKTRAREPQKEVSRSGKFACAQKSRSLHFPFQEAQQRHDGVLHDLPTGTNNSSTQNHNNALWCDNRNGTKKPDDPSIPKRKKKTAADQKSFSAAAAAAAASATTMRRTTGLVLHDDDFRPQNAGVPARPRLGASSSIYIPSHRMRISER